MILETKISRLLREGEVRSWWTASLTTTPAYKLADYTFTGQFSYMDDPSTSSVTEGFGLMFYVSRMYDPALGRFIQADSIVPGGVQGLDRYAYVNNSPLNYIDPSGHTGVCDNPDIADPECFGEDPWQPPGVALSEGGKSLLDFAEKFGLKPEDVIKAALAGEAAGWANDSNVMSQKEEAWGQRYQWYVKTFCYGVDTQNCKLNFYMTYSQSVRDSVNKLKDEPLAKVQLMMSQRYYGSANWDAGVRLFNAVQNPKPEWSSFDPDNNPADRDQLFDVGILSASVTSNPSIGSGYDQFSYFTRTVYRGVDSYSVILTYCQWQYWVNGKPALNGCHPASP